MFYNRHVTDMIAVPTAADDLADLAASAHAATRLLKLLAVTHLQFGNG